MYTMKLLQGQIKANSFNEADITVKQLKSVIGHSDRELMRLTGILNTRKMLTNPHLQNLLLLIGAVVG